MNQFLKDTVERAVRTFAQAELAVLVADGTGLFNTNWLAGVSTAGMAALLSILTSFGSSVVNPNGTASMLTLARGRATIPPV